MINKNDYIDSLCNFCSQFAMRSMSDAGWTVWVVDTRSV